MSSATRSMLIGDASPTVHVACAGLTNGATQENRRLSIDLAGLIVYWEQKAIEAGATTVQVVLSLLDTWSHLLCCLPSYCRCRGAEVSQTSRWHVLPGAADTLHACPVSHLNLMHVRVQASSPTASRKRPRDEAEPSGSVPASSEGGSGLPGAARLSRLRCRSWAEHCQPPAYMS